MTHAPENPGLIEGRIFQLGGLLVDPARNILKSESESFHLEPRIMQVLEALSAQALQVVSRDTLIETIWNVEFGADESLTRAISILRKTFRSAGEPDGHIETIPKRGYRLASPISYDVPKVSSKVVSKAPVKPVGKTSKQPIRIKRRYVSSAILAVALVISAFVFTSIQPIGTQLATGKGRSVAIMSFTDMSANKDQEYVSDGITEEIFTAMADIPNLRIAARSSSFAYKGKSADIRKVGNALNVSHIIDGSIRTQGNRLRVTAQLLNTADGLHVWTKSYDGTTRDIFELQERVSRDLVSELRVVLSIGLEETIPFDLETLMSTNPSTD